MTEDTRRDRFEAVVDATVPFATIAGLLVAIAITALSDVPSPLPGIALGSEALFHIERGLAVMAAIVIFLMLLVRGLRRELPSEATTTGLGYPPMKAAVTRSEAAVDSLAERVDRLDADQARQNDALRLVLRALKELEGKVQSVDEEK